MHVVAHESQLPAALCALRASMADTCVAIDLEWKPEGWAGNGTSRIALMQLASATVAVLVRVSHIGFRMPPSLRTFLRWVPNPAAVEAAGARDRGAVLEARLYPPALPPGPAVRLALGPSPFTPFLTHDPFILSSLPALQ